MSEVSTSDKPIEIEVNSIISARDLEPYVQLSITMPDGAVGRVQLTVAEARRQALFVLEAAEAALSDRLLLTFVKENMSGSDEMAGAVLEEFRKLRGTREHTSEVIERPDETHD